MKGVEPLLKIFDSEDWLIFLIIILLQYNII
jgi:hypothetical protein